MASIDDCYSLLQEIKSYFDIETDTYNTRDNVNSTNSFITMFFRILLHILYQFLCYLSHLSRNFYEREDYYNLEQSSLKIHIDVDFTVAKYIAWYSSNFVNEFFIAEIISCVSPTDDFLGGRVLNDTCNYDQNSGLFEFHYEFEVFCPFLDITLFSPFSNQEKEDLFTILVKNNGQSSLNSHLLLSQIQKNMSPSWADWIVQKSAPTEGDMTVFDGSISALPSIINLGVTTLVLFQDVVSNAFNWLDLLLDLLNSLYESMVAYQENNKLDRILECEFDAKKFNRLLGDALNYAMKDAGVEDPNHPDEYMFPVVSRNDQEYLDLNPDGQACLDWDGGLPAIVNHRHYNFKKVWCMGELDVDPIPYKLYIIPNWVQDLPQMCSPSDYPDKI